MSAIEKFKFAPLGTNVHDFNRSVPRALGLTDSKKSGSKIAAGSRSEAPPACEPDRRTGMDFKLRSKRR